LRGSQLARSGWQQSGHGAPVFGDRHFFAIVDPSQNAIEIMPQIPDGGCLHV
jgi:hypothetical protein